MINAFNRSLPIIDYEKKRQRKYYDNLKVEYKKIHSNKSLSTKNNTRLSIQLYIVL